MDRAVIERKLDSLRRCLERIAAKQPASATALETDLDLQDILVLNLTRAVQIRVDLATQQPADAPTTPPNTMGEAFDRLRDTQIIDAGLATRMRKAVGFRNIAVHAYETIDWSIAHAIAPADRNGFRRFAKCIAARIDR